MPNGRPAADTLGGLRPIFDVVKKINSESDLRRLLDLILDTMIEHCNAQRGTLVLYKGDKDKAKLSRDRAGRNLAPSEMGLSHSILGQVRSEGRMFLCDDARTDAQIFGGDSILNLQLLSVLCLPLRVKNKQIGVVYLDNPGVLAAFRAREVAIAEVLTEHAAIAIENATLYRHSIRDKLTKVNTHAYFEKRLNEEVSRARRKGRSLGMLMIDVDDFKGINDTYGHDTGNEVLRDVARTLALTLRGDDIVARSLSPLVARYGGDEFEVILPAAGRDGTLRAAERLVAALGNKVIVNGPHKVKLSISVGGAVYPDDAGDAHQLQLRADEALYKSKRSGKNRAVLCPSK